MSYDRIYGTYSSPVCHLIAESAEADAGRTITALEGTVRQLLMCEPPCVSKATWPGHVEAPGDENSLGLVSSWYIGTSVLRYNDRIPPSRLRTWERTPGHTQLAVMSPYVEGLEEMGLHSGIQTWVTEKSPSWCPLLVEPYYTSY